MHDAWEIKIWGARGSAPTPRADCLEYGGSTACISVRRGDALAVLDAGSGLDGLGAELLRLRKKRADILLSHLHLDHILGLFTSPLLHDPESEIHLYGGPGLADALSRLVGPPLWPVTLAECAARVEFHEVRCGLPFPLPGGLTAAALEGNHPGGCLYYRLEGGGRSLVYALDCELTQSMAARLTEFAAGADLLVWDACFAPGALKPGWGHATWEQGLTLGREAGVKTVLMTHYDRAYPDEFLHTQERLALRADGEDRRCRFAKEGMVIAL